HPTSDVDRARVAGAIATAAERRPDLDHELLELIGRALVLDEPGDDVQEFALRFQQLSAPVIARGLEDTAFYRWIPLPSANEVGADLGILGRGPDAFHAHNAAIASSWPGTMLALSTHDTKRTADVRARLSVLTEIADAWTYTVDTWRTANAQHRGDWDDPVME